MAGDLIDREYLDINGVEFEAETINHEGDKSAATINAMTKKNTPIGVAAGNVVYTVTADIAIRASQIAEIVDDLDELFEDNTEVPVITTQEGGKTISYEAGVITGLSDAASHGDAIKRSVTMTCWGRTT